MVWNGQGQGIMNITLNQLQKAWLKRISRYSGRRCRKLLTRLKATEATKNECFEFVVGEWLVEPVRKQKRRVRPAERPFSWSIELMFESPAFINKLLDRSGNSLTSKEIDQIVEALFGRVGFISCDPTSPDNSEEYEQIMMILKSLLSRTDFSSRHHHA